MDHDDEMRKDRPYTPCGFEKRGTSGYVQDVGVKRVAGGGPTATANAWSALAKIERPVMHKKPCRRVKSA